MTTTELLRPEVRRLRRDVIKTMYGEEILVEDCRLVLTGPNRSVDVAGRGMIH